MPSLSLQALSETGVKLLPLRAVGRAGGSVLRVHNGFPWWLSGKESTCQRRRCQFDPWSGKIPHALGQLNRGAPTTEPVLQSPGVAATEPTCLSYGAHTPSSPSSATREVTTVRSPAPQPERRPHPLELEKAHTAVKTQHSQKHLKKKDRERAPTVWGTDKHHEEWSRPLLLTRTKLCCHLQ